MRPKIINSLFCLLLFIMICCHPSSKKKVDEVKRYQDELLFVCQFYSDYYVYLEEKTGKTRQAFNSECKELTREIAEDNPRAGFIEGMKTIRAMFPDGHLGWRLKDVPKTERGTHFTNFAGDYFFLPIIFTMKNGHPVVGWRADEFTDISLNSQLVAVNDRPADNVIEEQIRCSPQSTRAASLEVAARTLSMYSTNYPCGFSPDGEVSFTFLSQDGREYSRTMTWQGALPFGITDNIYPSLENIPVGSKKYHGIVAYSLQINDTVFGVIHPSNIAEGGWNVDDFREALGGLKEKRIEKLVIDLKDTAGGHFSQAGVFLDLLNVKTSTHVNERGMKKGLLFHDSGDLYSSRIPVAWEGPVILYTNSICGSACDWFVEFFKISKRGNIIGQTTAGRAGGYSTASTDLVEFEVTWHDFQIPGQPPLEGRGVEPDVWCEGELVECLKIIIGTK